MVWLWRDYGTTMVKFEVLGAPPFLWHEWYGFGIAMARLRYNNPDVSIWYGTIALMSILTDQVLLGEGATFSKFGGQTISK